LEDLVFVFLLAVFLIFPIVGSSGIALFAFSNSSRRWVEYLFSKKFNIKIILDFFVNKLPKHL